MATDKESILESAPHVYSNVVFAHGTTFDVTLDFAYRADPSEEPERQVRLSMSWEHAIGLLGVLSNLVAGYKEQYPSIEHLERALAEETRAEAVEEAS